MEDLINSYTKGGLELKQQITDICYYMKGGIDWNSAWGMSFEDREIITKSINKYRKQENPGGKEYM